jgi:hypothetical protein
MEADRILIHIFKICMQVLRNRMQIEMTAMGVNG